MGKIKELKLNQDAKLIFECFSEDYYKWIDVTYCKNDKQILLGSFYVSGEVYGKEWIEFNRKFVFFMKEHYGYSDDCQNDDLYYYNDDNFGYKGITVVKLFDVDNETLYDSSQMNNDDMMMLYSSSSRNKKGYLALNKKVYKI